MFSIPFFGRDFPALTQKFAGNILAFFSGDDAHSVFRRYSARRFVDDRLRRTQHLEFQNVKPVISYDFRRFAHQTLAVPRKAQPKAAILVFSFYQADAANQVLGSTLKAQGPMPL